MGDRVVEDERGVESGKTGGTQEEVERRSLEGEREEEGEEDMVED